MVHGAAYGNTGRARSSSSSCLLSGRVLRYQAAVVGGSHR